MNKYYILCLILLVGNYLPAQQIDIKAVGGSRLCNNGDDLNTTNFNDSILSLYCNFAEP